VSWTHTTGVAGARPLWGKLVRKPVWENYWSFVAGTTEDATFNAGVFRVRNAAGGGASLARRALAGLRTPALALSAQGTAKAYYTRLVRFPTRRLKPGWYAYAIRLRATMNPERTSFFMSKPFRVGRVKHRS
jgi:hypothetical protein